MADEKKNFSKKEENNKQHNDYEEVVKKKLDKIIEQTSNENSALKKILENLNKPDDTGKKEN